jgi:hypothetical protein
MFILIWTIIVMDLLIFAAISEHEIAKQDEEWMKEAKEKNQWKKK